MEGSLLWVYEGQTQFWGYVLGARSGMLSKQDTLDAMRRPPRPTSSELLAAAWRPLVDTTNDPTAAGRAPQPWRSWQRSEDYYSEGQLIWIDVDRIIRTQSGGKRSIDDFASRLLRHARPRLWRAHLYVRRCRKRAFNGSSRRLARILQRRVYDLSPQPPLEGITQGWLQAWSSPPSLPAG
jgi:predicted metalloprotease with PDZ domain